MHPPQLASPQRRTADGGSSSAAQAGVPHSLFVRGFPLSACVQRDRGGRIGLGIRAWPRAGGDSMDVTAWVSPDFARALARALLAQAGAAEPAPPGGAGIGHPSAAAEPTCGAA